MCVGEIPHTYLPYRKETSSAHETAANKRLTATGTGWYSEETLSFIHAYDRSAPRMESSPSAISMALEAAAAAMAAVPIWSKRPSTRVLPSRAVNVESGDSSQLETASNNGLPRTHRPKRQHA